MNSKIWKIKLVNHRCGNYNDWEMLGIVAFEIISSAGDRYQKNIGFWRIFIDQKFQSTEWNNNFERHLDRFVKWAVAIIEILIDQGKLNEEVLVHANYEHNPLGRYFGEILMNGDLVPESKPLGQSVYEYKPSK